MQTHPLVGIILKMALTPAFLMSMQACPVTRHFHEADDEIDSNIIMSTFLKTC